MKNSKKNFNLVVSNIMDYNTQRKQLKLPEYGRAIQKMVDYCLQVEDKDERTKVAKTIINLMGITNPQIRDSVNFKHKLWDHLAIMSDFKLDINWEFEIPDEKIINKTPGRLEYSENDIYFRHYGKFSRNFIEKIKTIDNVEEKKYLIELLANNMKRMYIIWKKEYISDDIIFNEIKKMSKDSIEIPENLVLKEYKDILSNQPNNNNNLKKKTKDNRQKDYRPKDYRPK
ncbi:MAG: DUF4290 domain-containing protein [Bacteroidales bacterium]|nr:DUF4290 domain-containing protein [Bacteroidales bacterium]